MHETLAQVTIVEADLDNKADAEAVVAMIDAYARDPMGSARPLPESVRRDLIPGLKRHGGAVVLLARCGGDPVGVAVCLLGFSTFAARPLLNVHDLAVLPSHRGRGIAPRLLEAAEASARRRGCCKVTLEVRGDNHKARFLYQRLGYGNETDGELATLFLRKPLD